MGCLDGKDIYVPNPHWSVNSLAEGLSKGDRWELGIQRCSEAYDVARFGKNFRPATGKELRVVLAALAIQLAFLNQYEAYPASEATYYGVDEGAFSVVYRYSLFSYTGNSSGGPRVSGDASHVCVSNE